MVKKNKTKEFIEQLKNLRNKHTKILKPRLSYTSEYDMFSIIWGDKKVDSTIEANLLGEGDIRFDITKDGIIVGVEFENFSEILNKFDCDKDEQKT